MRYAIFIIVLLTVIAGVYIYVSSRPTSNIQTNQSNFQPPTSNLQFSPPPTTIIEYDTKRFAVFIQPITDPTNLMLIPNFEEKKSSQEIMKENNCRYGINGGFYTTDNKPLGLFIADGNQIQVANTESLLINGFLMLHSDGTLEITTDPSLARPGLARLALQAGPYFIPESALKINDDEYARRMLVAQDGNGNFYFIVITEEENAHSGPLLADLPRIVSLIPNSLFSIHNSVFLNLDGGSASAFYSTSGVKLQELVLIGSLLCGK